MTRYWIIEKGITDFNLMMSDTEPKVREITVKEYEDYKAWIERYAKDLG